MKLKSKYKKILILFNLFIIGIVSLVLLDFTKSTEIENLEDGSRVAANSELTYYLNISYDGIDRDSYNSKVPQDGVTSKLYSGYIYVEDKIPDGLTFQSFKVGEDGTVGAVNTTTGKVCVGTIYNDTKSEEESTTNYRGLHYNTATRTVSFRVKDLQAGCNLTVGIITKTPTTTDNLDTSNIELRRDFYNFATAREKNLTKQSNTVHVWMGLDTVAAKEVIYQYAEGTPDNAPDLPPTMQYSEGTSVGVATSPYIEGYKFNGWTTSDATITSNSFRMPNKTVTLTGSFEKITPYTVSYEIEGDIPDGYTPPTDKEYYQNDMVSLDSLEKGTELNGYRFLGWTLKEGNVSLNSENDFEMPEENVKFVGKFELMTYKVEYRFYDTLLPPNHETLLPETKEYRPGTIISLENIEDVEGYHFLGWYKEDNFEMPEEDIIIYGEWSPEMSLFKLNISKKIISERAHYKMGDTVKYAITVNNPNEFEVKNIRVQENNPKAFFTSDDNYELKNDRVAEILSLPTKGNITIYAEYKVEDESSKYITNEVQITGASVGGNYELNLSKEIKDNATFKLYSKLNICKTIDTKITNSYAFHITGTNYDTWLNVDANNCKKIYIPDGEYEISELIPQTNELDTITLSSGLSGSVNGNKATFTIGDSIENEITYTNKYKKKGFYKSNGEVKNVVEPKILNNIIKKKSVIDNISSKYVSLETGIDFNYSSSLANGNGIYLRAGTENDDYPIYYYRGNVNNNIIFAGYCWKIVRTTETGGIKLIYNGTQNDGICDSTGVDATIGKNRYNSKYNFGYTYDTNTSSTIKTLIDNWYMENILNKYDNYLEDTIWCNDRSITKNGTIGYDSNQYIGFAVRSGLDKEEPKVTCALLEDSYTVEEKNGNGLLDYPIALITADEAQLAGYQWQHAGIWPFETDKSIGAGGSYLVFGEYFWTMSPACAGTMISLGRSSGANATRFTFSDVTYFATIRPSISLRNGTMISGGDGTPRNPYIVE